MQAKPLKNWLFVDKWYEIVNKGSFLVNPCKSFSGKGFSAFLHLVKNENHLRDFLPPFFSFQRVLVPQ